MRPWLSVVKQFDWTGERHLTLFNAACWLNRLITTFLWINLLSSSFDIVAKQFQHTIKLCRKINDQFRIFFHSQSPRWYHPLTNLSRRTQSLPFVCPPRLKLSVLSRALAFQRAIIPYGKTNRKMTILDTSGLKARWDTWRLRMLEEGRFYTWSSIYRYLPLSQC